jgi:hypothetical protein
MSNRVRHGLWVAYGGVACQLTGLTWDAVLHSLNPALAASEGVFTLVNPSHALIIVGLALTVAGLVSALLADVPGLRGASKRAMAPLAGSVALLMLFGVMGGTGLVTAGTSGAHDHGSAGGQSGVSTSARSDDHSHESADEQLASAANDPQLAPLLEIMRTSGTKQALIHLEELASRDDAVRSEAHGLAHTMGRLSLLQYGNLMEAFGQCRETFASGCYHGVLEGYLANQPRVDAQTIAGLCSKTVPQDSTIILKFQCVHGLGHGLVAHFDADIFKALGLCDALSTDWDRSSCYGGVFMENIMVEWNQRFGAPSAGTGHVHYTRQSMLKQEDPLYPCNSVAEKYRRECYFLQSSAISMFNDNDFQATLQACDTAPEKYIVTCYQSAGRDISGFTLRDGEKALKFCLLGNDRYEGYCIVGVVREIINFSWHPDDGFAFCTLVPDASKPLCYKGIGEHVDALFVDKAEKLAECSKAPEAYRAACEGGARLDRPN